MSDLLLQVQDLRIAFAGREVVHGVGFSLHAGEKLALVGESGSGKTVTALSLLRLAQGASVTGSARLFDPPSLPGGRDLLSISERELRGIRGDAVSFIFQEPMTALNPLQRIGEQVAEPLRLKQGLSRSDARAEALRLLDRVRLPQAASRLDALPHQLSGGQRQRVLLAIALACRPLLLIADEATTALDASLQRDMMDLLTGFVDADGMALLLVSHDLALMAERSDRLLVMYAGSIVESGSTDAVLGTRAHPYTQGLFASRARLGLPRRTRLPTIPGRVPALGASAPGCLFSDRCPLAIASCRNEWPVAVALSATHQARCLRIDAARAMRLGSDPAIAGQGR